MLNVAIFLPLAAELAIAAMPAERRDLIRLVAVGAAGLTLVIVAGLWIAFEPGGGMQFVTRVPWIETLGISYATGIDGLSLPLVALTALLFLSGLVFTWDETGRPRAWFAWMLFLETASLGVFSAQDLFLFYIFWDLTLVGMFFIIALWGHEGARAAAFKFFIYTFVGSMALLLGIIGLYLSGEGPSTTDMLGLAERRPLADAPLWLRELVFFALAIGFAIKTPTAPVHTWLPPAHVEAPAAGSLILAGIMLKMGTYGFFRFLLEMLPGVTAEHGLLLLVVGIFSVIYGALLALAQTNVKRLVAYTSVNHMGYVVMAVGAVALAGAGETQARQLAIDGAVLQMVSHGLITGALFLLCGVIYARAGTYDVDRLGGLARPAPLFAGAFAFAAFASLGLPGLSGFVAEFQIFLGTFGLVPWAAVIAATGIVLTAGLFLWTLQRLLMGEPPEEWRGFADMSVAERLAILPLLALVLLIGLWPAWILEVIAGYGLGLAAALGR